MHCLLVPFALAAQSWSRLLPFVGYEEESSAGDISGRSPQGEDQALAKRQITPPFIEPAAAGGSAGVLTLPIFRSRKPGLISRSLEVQLEKEDPYMYLTELNIGTPPQTVTVILDTGSDRLWVNPDCSNIPSSEEQLCQDGGWYNPCDSSTATETNYTDIVQFLPYDSADAFVREFKDDISLPGSKTMKGVKFGVAMTSFNAYAGILGIGPVNYTDPSQVSCSNSFISQLQEQGVIKTKAFSLALGGKYEEKGVIKFGGLDKAKFTGHLVPLQIIPGANSPDNMARYWVPLQSISHTSPIGVTVSANFTVAVFLDCGSSISELPRYMVNELVKPFGLTEKDQTSDGLYPVDCSLKELGGTIAFHFPGLTLNVPYKEIIIECSTDPSICCLGIRASNDGAVLGNSFLRSAYVVFDLESSIVYMAPYHNCGTKVSNINGPDDLKNVTGACGDSPPYGINAGAPLTVITTTSSATITEDVEIRSFTEGNNHAKRQLSDERLGGRLTINVSDSERVTHPVSVKFDQYGRMWAHNYDRESVTSGLRVERRWWAMTVGVGVGLLSVL
ncbi:Fc.00g001820.m01.CDS01 [Cosmosporella sp. VM-42]